MHEGLSIIEIGKRVGLTKSTVFKHVRDIPPPPSGFAMVNRPAALRRYHSEKKPRSKRADRLPPKQFADLSSDLKGKIAEAKFEIECFERKIEILKPVLGSSRYDYVISIGGVFKKVQVKWSDGRSNRTGSITIGLTKPRGTRSSIRKAPVSYDKSEIDYVFAYLPVLDKFVVLGPDVFHKRTSLQMCIDDPLNNQRAKVRYAKHFLWTKELPL